MKTSTASTRSATRIGLAIAAFTLAGYAAGGLTSEQLAQAAPAQASTSGEAQPCSADPSQTLLLKSPDGKAFQLVHFRGCGWKQMAAEELDTNRQREWRRGGSGEPGGNWQVCCHRAPLGWVTCQAMSA